MDCIEWIVENALTVALKGAFHPFLCLFISGFYFIWPYFLLCGFRWRAGLAAVE